MSQADALAGVGDPEQAVVVGGQWEVDLDERLADEAGHALRAGKVSQCDAHRSGEVAVWLRKAPDRRPLEHGQVCHLGSDGGDHLHG